MEDLLCDETFLSWYFKTDAGAIRRWERWIADNPGSGHRVQQAVDFLSSLTLKEEAFTRDQITWGEKVLLDKVRKAGKLYFAPAVSFRRRAWIAAASIVLLLAGVAAIHSVKRKAEWRTSYGEVRINSLPDGTEVMANADTRMSYSPNWADGRDREVWLTGEAFFHVRKTPSGSRFIVHARRFDVIVTGTQFNVISREGKANVLLEEGSVLLHTAAGEELKMKPGDFVEVDHDRLAKRMVRMDSVTAWKEHKLSFFNTSLRDVAEIITEQYGVTVRLEDTVGTKTVTGIMQNDNLDVLLKALEATTDFKIVRRNDEIRIF
jgi:ferric-dicitrate binding protein FerR (iron transport regulator)